MLHCDLLLFRLLEHLAREKVVLEEEMFKLRQDVVEHQVTKFIDCSMYTFPK
jgi:hypothetical protein